MPGSRPLNISAASLGALALAALLGACGGGSSDGWGLQYLNFDSGASTLDLAAGGSTTQFSPSWQASRTGGNPAYSVRVHLVPANTTNPVLNDNTAILGANCGPVITGCDGSGTQACSYVAGSDPSMRRIDCGETRGIARTRDRPTGAYAVIGQLCYTAPDLSSVCAEKPAIPLTLR